MDKLIKLFQKSPETIQHNIKNSKNELEKYIEIAIDWVNDLELKKGNFPPKGDPKFLIHKNLQKYIKSLHTAGKKSELRNLVIEEISNNLNPYYGCYLIICALDSFINCQTMGTFIIDESGNGYANTRQFRHMNRQTCFKLGAEEIGKIIGQRWLLLHNLGLVDDFPDWSDHIASFRSYNIDENKFFTGYVSNKLIDEAKKHGEKHPLVIKASNPTFYTAEFYGKISGSSN